VPELSELAKLVAAVIGAATGIWGAGLSTFIYLTQRRRDHSKLKVEIRDPEQGDDFHAPVLQLSAVNVGYPDVHLRDAAIILKNGEELVTKDLFTKHDDLPCMLKKGYNFTASITINHLYGFLLIRGYKEDDCVMLWGKLLDSAGNVYKGPRYKYLVRSWTQKSIDEIIYEPIKKASERAVPVPGP
jgi:hypothetical protein